MGLVVAVGIGVLILLLALVAGLVRGSSRAAFISAIACYASTLAVTIGIAWINDQSGIIWLLIIPATFVSVALIGATGVSAVFATGAAVRHRRALNWQFARPFAVYLVLALSILAVHQIWLVVSRTSESNMVANFHRHQPEFQRLAEMALEDRRFRGISETGYTPNATPGTVHWQVGLVPLREERHAEYRALLQATDVREGISIGREPPSVDFGYWEIGLVTSSTHLGYLYTTQRVSPLLDSIQDVQIPIVNGKRIYRRLDEYWYIYYVRY